MLIKILYQNDNLNDSQICHFISFDHINNYDKVVYINCSNNNLTLIPELPNSVQYICCERNKLNSLPELPNSLQRLWCNDNKFIKKQKYKYLIKIIYI
jgi:hypothetical protein